MLHLHFVFARDAVNVIASTTAAVNVKVCDCIYFRDGNIISIYRYRYCYIRQINCGLFGLPI